MVTFTVTLKDARTTDILRPEELKLASACRTVSENHQYEFDVIPKNCPAFSRALQADERIIGWQAKGSGNR